MWWFLKVSRGLTGVIVDVCIAARHQSARKLLELHVSGGVRVSIGCTHAVEDEMNRFVAAAAVCCWRYSCRCNICAAVIIAAAAVR